MIHLQNNTKPAFTLIEVIIALCIAAILLPPLLILQMNTFKSTHSYSQSFLQVIQARQYLVEKKISRELQEEIAEKSEEPMEELPDGMLHYEAKKISKKSSLGKIKNLHQETVTIKWPSTFGVEKETVVSFFYKPEKEAKE